MYLFRLYFMKIYPIGEPVTDQILMAATSRQNTGGLKVREADSSLGSKITPKAGFEAGHRELLLWKEHVVSGADPRPRSESGIRRPSR